MNDPSLLLRQAREAMERLRKPLTEADEVAMVREARNLGLTFGRLDTWLSLGGRPPSEWRDAFQGAAAYDAEHGPSLR